MDGWQAAVEDHLMHLGAGGATKGTLRLRRHWLTTLARQMDGRGPWDVSTDDLARFLSAPHWMPETRKSARSAIRGFYSWAVDSERAAADPSRRLPSVRIPTSVPKPAPEDVVRLALAAAGPRERLMVLLAATAGLRISEVASVHTANLTARPDGVWLRVKGKGGKTRRVPLSPPLSDALTAAPDGWLFPGGDDGHLTAGHVGQLLKRLLGRGYSAHTLRHRFATVAYAADRDVFAVQQLLGHSRPETTMRYTALPDGSLRSGASAAAL